jgi:hypothetical protein
MTEALGDTRVVTLNGARQAGKTGDRQVTPVVPMGFQNSASRLELVFTRLARIR